MAGLAGRISDWIASSVREAGMNGAVLGLSGGLDSAVTAALCKRALGERALGVIMPCESDQRDEEDALRVAAKLGMTTVTVRLDRPFRALAGELDAVGTTARSAPPGAVGTTARSAPPGAKPVLARANLKPRLRMAVLYHFANSLSRMVVGAGNKTEFMVGYFTKYGDGGADILPLAGLYKTQVRELARVLGLPQDVITKPPSAGLWAGQTDEEDLGITYEELDRALEAIETGRTEAISPGTLDKVRGMVAASAHKRSFARIFEP